MSNIVLLLKGCPGKIHSGHCTQDIHTFSAAVLVSRGSHPIHRPSCSKIALQQVPWSKVNHHWGEIKHTHPPHNQSSPFLNQSFSMCPGNQFDGTNLLMACHPKFQGDMTKYAVEEDHLMDEISERIFLKVSGSQYMTHPPVNIEMAI